MSNLMIQEEWVSVQGDKSYRTGNSDIYEAFTDKPGELFRAFLQDGYRCVSSVYVDIDGKPKRVGWVFQRRQEFQDCDPEKPETFLLETWVTLHDAEPTRNIDYHYHVLN